MGHYLKWVPRFLFQINAVWHFDKEKLYHSFYKNMMLQKLISTSIRNVSWAANHHIRVISEGSCDTEDWGNDAKYIQLCIARINYILKYITLKLFF